MNRTSQTSLQAARSRLFYVDSARALAIVMVTAFHLWRYFGFHELWVGPFPIHKLAAFGYAGVDLFFAVSGFAMMLTWSNRAERSTRPISSFYAARAERIIPPYVVAVIFFSAMSIAGLFPFAHTMRDIIAHLTFTHTLFPTTFFSVAGVFWSLAVEVQFYLAFPLLVRLTSRGLGVAFLVAIVASVGLDHWAPSDGPMSFVYRWNVIGFAPLFIVGMLIQRHRYKVQQGRWLTTCCVGAAIVLMITLPATSTDLYSRLSIGAILALGLLLFLPDNTPRVGAKAISSIALASYSIYLYNYVFIATPSPIIGGWPGAALYFVGIFAVGAMAWGVIERPVEWLRHRGRRRFREIAVHNVPNT